MRQTSEQFADAMLSDETTPGNAPNFAEQIAKMEKTLSEKIEKSHNEIFQKITEQKNSVEMVEVTDEVDNNNEENNEDEGENENENN